MAELTVGSGINRIFPMRTSVQARRAVQVADYLRDRTGESGAGFHPAG